MCAHIRTMTATGFSSATSPGSELLVPSSSFLLISLLFLCSSCPTRMFCYVPWLIVSTWMIYLLGSWTDQTGMSLISVNWELLVIFSKLFLLQLDWLIKICNEHGCDELMLSLVSNN
jgi:hypothetical protein